MSETTAYPDHSVICYGRVEYMEARTMTYAQAENLARKRLNDRLKSYADEIGGKYIEYGRWVSARIDTSAPEGWDEAELGVSAVVAFWDSEGKPSKPETKPVKYVDDVVP